MTLSPRQLALRATRRSIESDAAVDLTSSDGGTIDLLALTRDWEFTGADPAEVDWLDTASEARALIRRMEFYPVA